MGPGGKAQVNTEAGSVGTGVAPGGRPWVLHSTWSALRCWPSRLQFASGPWCVPRVTLGYERASDLWELVVAALGTQVESRVL